MVAFASIFWAVEEIFERTDEVIYENVVAVAVIVVVFVCLFVCLFGVFFVDDTKIVCSKAYLSTT